MSDYQVAFFIGLFGSVHCVGMCGPLALSIPSYQNSWWIIVFEKLLYNFGRVITYTLLGLLIGIIGRQLWLMGLQQGVSILSGILIIFAGLSRIFKLYLPRSKYFSIPVSAFNKLLHYALKQRAGHLLIGMLNGLLPCGFVYLAMVGAVNTPSALTAGQYMFWFGIGTLPLMLLATIGSGFVGYAMRRRINESYTLRNGVPGLLVYIAWLKFKYTLFESCKTNYKWYYLPLAIGCNNLIFTIMRITQLLLNYVKTSGYQKNLLT